jgi:hypothetical protein
VTTTAESQTVKSTHPLSSGGSSTRSTSRIDWTPLYPSHNVLDPKTVTDLLEWQRWGCACAFLGFSTSPLLFFTLLTFVLGITFRGFSSTPFLQLLGPQFFNVKCRP